MFLPWQVVLRDLCGGASVTLLMLAGKPDEWKAAAAEGNLREKQVSETVTVAATEEEEAPAEPRAEEPQLFTGAGHTLRAPAVRTGPPVPSAGPSPAERRATRARNSRWAETAGWCTKTNLHTVRCRSNQTLLDALRKLLSTSNIRKYTSRQSIGAPLDALKSPR